VLQGTDVGRETDDVEEILLETEWYVVPFLRFGGGLTARLLDRSSKDSEVVKEASERIIALFVETN
jgi:hypothetical protein